jgi:hypothetical protein
MSITQTFHAACDWPGCKKTTIITGCVRTRVISELKNQSWLITPNRRLLPTAPGRNGHTQKGWAGATSGQRRLPMIVIHDACGRVWSA